jgi:hypothetical protein
MFSTIDSQDRRFARLHVITDRGEIFAAEIPDAYRGQIDRARLLPGDSAAAALAGNLLGQAWERTEGNAPGFPPTAMFPTLRPAAEREVPDAMRVKVKAIRIEIYTLSYDPSSHRLSTELVRAVEARKP